MVVFAMIALLGGLFQINPIWLFGPYEARGRVGRQPARLVRHVPRRLDPSDARLGDQIRLDRPRLHIPPLFWPTVVLPGILTMLPMFYPFIEARLIKDKASTTTCCSARVTCRRAPRSARWPSRSTSC